MKAEWTKNTESDAEFNAYVATVNGHRLDVFSDRGEGEWMYRVDDGETRFGYDSKFQAMKEAELDAK